MVWTFLCLKIAILPLPIPESNRTCTSEVSFFPRITFWRYTCKIKSSDLERRNRKLSAHDCTGSYQNYFLPITTAKQSTKHSRHIVRTFFGATLLVVATWKRSTRIDSTCCGGIITGSFVSLLTKKYQQDKK